MKKYLVMMSLLLVSSDVVLQAVQVATTSQVENGQGLCALEDKTRSFVWQ